MITTCINNQFAIRFECQNATIDKDQTSLQRQSLKKPINRVLSGQ